MPYPSSRQFQRAAREAQPWVFIGATSLAAVAGFVNVFVLGFFHVPVSHMTGAVSRLSIDLQSGDSSDLQLIAAILSGFLAGALISGVLIGRRRVSPGANYAYAL